MLLEIPMPTNTAAVSTASRLRLQLTESLRVDVEEADTELLLQLHHWAKLAQHSLNQLKTVR